MLRAVAAAAAVLCSTAAQADAVFQWFPVTGQGFSGRFAVTDEAFFAGGLSANLVRPSPQRPISDSPLLAFSYAAMSFNPRSFGGFTDAMRFSLTFRDGLALGSIDGRTDNDFLDMASQANNIWRVNRYATDAPNQCQPNGIDRFGCSGELGRWLLVSAPVARPSTNSTGSGQVPLPGTLALLALGGLGLTGMLRRRAA